LKRNVTAHYFLKVALFSPARIVVCKLGKTACASKASDSNSPPHTVAHVLQYGTEEDIALAFDEEFQRLNDGRPAWIRVTNCWLKMRTAPA